MNFQFIQLSTFFNHHVTIIIKPYIYIFLAMRTTHTKEKRDVTMRRAPQITKNNTSAVRTRADSFTVATREIFVFHSFLKFIPTPQFG
ncbi:MAG: hypothetical protein A2744_04140 [Candidatus Buchananbacteria bacterium RIFCSPHIGHO2_01_FULL_44_11]|uniref:Uncharacterized protein n=1 Tax=Candidatus Buchananbacteria bacterium RIFCSPHIGHO2_01_FULL_44_11 TaxID=1797535 RepID=A0A1G1Y050_9BACT|nr:MAG: hypothetical protein A2744_04140 [Candidatus Buchananbacteria bacterium RIFCSPHIGHO2_01_FULL_44_11]